MDKSKKTLTPHSKRVLSKYYYNIRHPGAYSGFDKFWKSLENEGKADSYSKAEVKKWLNAQETYSLHRPVIRSFKRRRVYVESINEQIEGDLIVLEKKAQANEGYKYILVCIDVFSKYAWAKPLKTKNGSEVKEKLSEIIGENPPLSFRSDSGGEFINTHVKNFLISKGVKQFITRNETKSNIIERFIRTFKGKMFRYFTKHQTHRYIDILNDLIFNYNNSYHRSIKMAPTEVNSLNEQEVWENLYPELLPPKPPPVKKPVKQENKSKTVKKPYKKPFKYKLKDLVRISHLKHPFSRGFNQQWTDEIFKIESRTKTSPYTYKLVDYYDDPITGTFYESELVKVTETKNPVFRIEKIVLTRKRQGKTEYLVKWQGWPSKFNSFVDKNAIQSYKQSKK